MIRSVSSVTPVSATVDERVPETWLRLAGLSVVVLSTVGAVGLILAWKVAGYYGVDRWLLPLLGTPWKPAVLSSRDANGPGGATG